MTTINTIAIEKNLNNAIAKAVAGQKTGNNALQALLNDAIAHALKTGKNDVSNNVIVQLQSAEHKVQGRGDPVKVFHGNTINKVKAYIVFFADFLEINKGDLADKYPLVTKAGNKPALSDKAILDLVKGLPAFHQWTQPKADPDPKSLLDHFESFVNRHLTDNKVSKMSQAEIKLLNEMASAIQALNELKANDKALAEISEIEAANKAA